jgi:hypothetical protein
LLPVRYRQTYRVELNVTQKTGRWIISRIVIVILTYHRHKLTDLVSEEVFSVKLVHINRLHSVLSLKILVERLRCFAS